MEIVKNIAAILGVILSLSGVIALFSSNAKLAIARLFKKFGREDEIDELKKMLQEHIEEDRAFKAEMKKNNDIAMEFTRTQCRTVVKDMFYKYFDVKSLPLYEYKTLLTVEELYIKKCKGNSYASELIKIMKTWEIDYTKSQIDED